MRIIHNKSLLNNKKLIIIKNIQPAFFGPSSRVVLIRSIIAPTYIKYPR